MRSNPPPPRRVRTAHESRSATVRAAAAAPSRRQQSRWQREQHHQHLLYIAVGALLVLVLAILGGGLLYDNVIRANEVIAQIGSENITASQLLDEMRPTVRSIDTQAKQVGSGTNVTQYVAQQKRDLPDQTLNNLIDRKLIEQEAARRGITVAPAEVDEKERQTVAEVSAAANPSPTAVPSPTTESAASATPATSASPTLRPSPTPVPTLDPPSYATALQQLLDRNGVTESDVRTELGRGLLREKVQAAIGEEKVPPTQEQIHARHILVATADEANSVLDQLRGGADFDQLADSVSTDPGTKGKGGDLGWFAHGVMEKPFEDAAFALQPGQLSGVVQGSNGFHVIEVLERDPNHALDPSTLQSLRQNAWNDWLNTRRTSSDVKLQLSQSEKDWLLTRIGVKP